MGKEDYRGWGGEKIKRSGRREKHVEEQLKKNKKGRKRERRKGGNNEKQQEKAEKMTVERFPD